MAFRVVCMFSFSLCFLHAAFGISTSTVCTTNSTTSDSGTAVTVESLEECAATETPTTPYLRCSVTTTSQALGTTAVVTSSYSCSATSPADLPIFIDAARSDASASASAGVEGTCHGVADNTISPAADFLTSDANNSCSIVVTGIYANTTTLDLQSDTSSHCTVTTTSIETGIFSSAFCSSVTLTREGLELLVTAAVNSSCNSTSSASHGESISVSTLCSSSTLVTDRFSTSTHLDTTTNCTVISSISSGTYFTVCFVDTIEDALSAAYHLQTPGLSFNRKLAALPPV